MPSPEKVEVVATKADAPSQSPPSSAAVGEDDLEGAEGDFVSSWLAACSEGAGHDPALVELVSKHRKGGGLAEGPLLKALQLYAQHLADSLGPARASKVVGGTMGGQL